MEPLDPVALLFGVLAILGVFCGIAAVMERGPHPVDMYQAEMDSREAERPKLRTGWGTYTTPHEHGEWYHVTWTEDGRQLGALGAARDELQRWARETQRTFVQVHHLIADENNTLIGYTTLDNPHFV